MKFLVQFQVKPGSKDQIVEAFEQRGPGRNPGVKFEQAWVATRSDLVFVLVESDNEAILQQACCTWADPGNFQIHSVIDLEQY